MSLSEQFRPHRLADVVGQPSARVMAQWCKNAMDGPPPANGKCFGFYGPPGCGKTTTALCVATELGIVDDNRHFDLYEIVASELTVDTARDMVRWLNFRPRGKFKLLLIEELERLHGQTQVLLKRELERTHGCNVVIATSNDTAGLQPALLQRFTMLQFKGYRDTDGFAAACCRPDGPIVGHWNELTGGQPMPRGWQQWGYANGNAGEFSLRVAYDRMEIELLRVAAECAA